MPSTHTDIVTNATCKGDYQLSSSFLSY